MKNITMSKNALPKELADNYYKEEKSDYCENTNDISNCNTTEYEDIKDKLNSLIQECEESYKNKAKKEMYDFIISLKMAKHVNL